MRCEEIIAFAHHRDDQAETVLLQAAWWLLWMQAQLDDLMKVYDVAASKAPNSQPKH